MKFDLYSIRDLKTTFYSPKVETNEASAVRNFAMVINEPGSPCSFAPGDFELYKVGCFDSDSGTIESVIPQFVVAGTSLVGVK